VDEKAMSKEAEGDLDEDDEIDDQTAALLEGFESDDEEMIDDMPGFEKGDKIPAISAEAKNALKKSKKTVSQDDKPGIVYIGRIPHGFYENEMREYFKQFGTILRLRMSRNKKTGSSRHFAFVEFESADVADIVARTMDNYIMFNHILKVKLIPDGQTHKDMFIGANKRFKKVPWNKLRGRELEQGASEEQWGKRIEKENQRRANKVAEMKKIGYEFEAPKIKSPEGISVRFSKEVALVGTQAVPTERSEEVKQTPVLPTVEEAEDKALETAAVVKEISKSEAKKGKGSKKSKATDAQPEVSVEAIVDSVVPKVDKSGPKKKEKKAKKAGESTESAAETITTTAVSPIEESAPKKTKGKSVKKAVELVESAPVIEESVPKKKKSKDAQVTESVVDTVVYPVTLVVDEAASKKTKGRKEKKVVESVAVIDTVTAPGAEVTTAPKSRKNGDPVRKSEPGEESDPKDAASEVTAALETLDESSILKKRGDRGRKAKMGDNSEPKKAKDIVEIVETLTVDKASKPKKKKAKNAKAGDEVAA
jgi:nucleolar protein 15